MPWAFVGGCLLRRQGELAAINQPRSAALDATDKIRIE
jgi:hypothetical protein